MSMSFMCQKSFHPNSKANQKARWIAEQRAKQESINQQQLHKQYEEERVMLQKYSSSLDPKASEVSFMYQPPPGYMNMVNKNTKKPEEEENTKEKQQNPLLKNAPTEGEYTAGIQVTHKPFGLEVRNSRCTRCGVIGHRSGDRECTMRNQDPNDTVNKSIEDPLSVMRTEGANQGKIAMKRQIASITHGAGVSDALQTLVTSDDEGEVDAESLVATLTPKQRKRLLKKMKKMKKKERKERKKQEVWMEASIDSDASQDEEPSSRKRKRSPSVERDETYRKRSRPNNDYEDDKHSSSSRRYDERGSRRQYDRERDERINSTSSRGSEKSPSSRRREDRCETRYEDQRHVDRNESRYEERRSNRLDDRRSSRDEEYHHRRGDHTSSRNEERTNRRERSPVRDREYDRDSDRRKRDHRSPQRHPSRN